MVFTLSGEGHSIVSKNVPFLWLDLHLKHACDVAAE